MTYRHILPLFLVTATLAAGAQAQQRAEPPESPFVWDALGATPSLHLPQRAAPAAVKSAPQDAPARARVTAAKQDEFTVDTLVKDTPMRRPAERPAPQSAEARR
jgi:hypothetical protein